MKNIVLKLTVFSLFPFAAFAEDCSVLPECAEIGFAYTAAECGQKSKLKCPFGEGYFCSSCDTSQGYYDECPEWATCSASRNANGCYTISYCNGARGYSPEGDGEWDTHQSTGVEYPIVTRYGNNVYEEICLKTAGCIPNFSVPKDQWDAEYKDWFYNSNETLGGLTCYSRGDCNTSKGFYHECPNNMTSVGTKTFIDGYTCHKCACDASYYGGYNKNNENYDKIRYATDGVSNGGCYYPQTSNTDEGWYCSNLPGDPASLQNAVNNAIYEYSDYVDLYATYTLGEPDTDTSTCYQFTKCKDGNGVDDEGFTHSSSYEFYDGDDTFECALITGCDNANSWYDTIMSSNNDSFSYTKEVVGSNGPGSNYSCRKITGCSAYASSNPGTSSPFIWEKETKGNYTCYRQQACNATQGYYNLTGGPNRWFCPADSVSSTTTPVAPASSISPYFHCGKCQGSNYGTKSCTAAGFYASQAACIKNGSNNCRQVYGTNCWAPIGNQCAADRQTLFNNGLKGYVYENLYTGSVLDLTSSDPCPNGCGIRGDYLDSNQKPLVECDEEGNMQCRNRYHADIQCSEAVSSWDNHDAPVKFKKVCSGSTCCASIDWSDIQTKLTQCHNAGGDFEELYIMKSNPINVNSLSQ